MKNGSNQKSSIIWNQKGYETVDHLLKREDIQPVSAFEGGANERKEKQNDQLSEPVDIREYLRNKDGIERPQATDELIY